jgi:hypothetical protein
LSIPFEQDDDGLDLLKLDHLSWLRLLGEVLRIALPYSTMGETLVEISSNDHYHQMDTELQAYDIFQMPILKMRFDLINYWINSSFSTKMVSWRYTWDHTQSYSSRHTQYRIKSLITKLHITPWITPWSSHNLL